MRRIVRTHRDCGRRRPPWCGQVGGQRSLPAPSCSLQNGTATTIP